MSGVSITGLDPASTLTGSEIVPIVQSGTTVRTTLAAMPYVPAGTGAVTTTIQSKLRETVSVKDFGAVGDGVTDDTAAIQAAINYFSLGNGTVYFPTGSYKVTSTITVAQDKIYLIGAGSWATKIVFAPTANATCIKISKGASVLYQGAIKGFGFYSSDSTYTKTALEIIDVSGYDVEDISVSGSVVSGSSYFWSGGSGSRGIWVKGRESTQINRLYIFADKPIQISPNPNSTISIDHFYFVNCYLGANNYPCVSINDGVNLTNVVFDGYQAWVLGTYGLYWLDSTSSSVSQDLTLKNVRTEQGTNSSSYSIYIAHNTNLQQFSIYNSQLDSARNGVYLRKIERASFYGVIDGSSSASHTILDVDSTVKEIDIRNCYWNTGAVASVVGQNIILSNQGPISAALPATVLYTSVTNPVTQTSAANSGYEITLANNGTASLGPNTSAGMITIVDNSGLSAIFNLVGTNANTFEVSDPAGFFSKTSGTATSTNIYWSSANNRYEIENKRGVSLKYKIIFSGTYNSF